MNEDLNPQLEDIGTTISRMFVTITPEDSHLDIAKKCVAGMNRHQIFVDLRGETIKPEFKSGGQRQNRNSLSQFNRRLEDKAWAQQTEEPRLAWVSKGQDAAGNWHGFTRVTGRQELKRLALDLAVRHGKKYRDSRKLIETMVQKAQAEREARENANETA